MLYLYSEHYRGEAEPNVHAQALRARGAWIRGAINPAARGWSQVDGPAAPADGYTGLSSIPPTTRWRRGSIASGGGLVRAGVRRHVDVVVEVRGFYPWAARGSAARFDPAVRGRSQATARQLLRLDTADNAVEAGIYRV